MAYGCGIWNIINYLQPSFWGSEDWVYDTQQYNLFSNAGYLLCKLDDLFTDYIADEAFSNDNSASGDAGYRLCLEMCIRDRNTAP